MKEDELTALEQLSAIYANLATRGEENQSDVHTASMDKLETIINRCIFNITVEVS